jgi:hypothetical protein
MSWGVVAVVVVVVVVVFVAAVMACLCVSVSASVRVWVCGSGSEGRVHPPTHRYWHLQWQRCAASPAHGTVHRLGSRRPCR